MPVSTFPIALYRISREAASRTSRFGLRSGRICVQTHLVNAYLKRRNRGLSARVECPCCGWRGYAFKALDIGQYMLPQLECPQCTCHDRHRMMNAFLSRRPPAFMEKAARVLHFAPEPHIANFLRERPQIKVFSCDIVKWGLHQGIPPYFLQDIHNLPLADNTIDGLFNVHVLEHVTDDRRAIQEFLRVLKPGGVAVIMAPFDPTRDTTDEWGAPNPEIYDHVRNYSAKDFHERLSGFEYEAVHPRDLLSPEEIDRYKIRPTEIIFVCTKPGGA